MQATVPGMNRTGAAVSPQGTQAMTRAAQELAPPQPIDATYTWMPGTELIREPEPGAR